MKQSNARFSPMAQLQLEFERQNAPRLNRQQTSILARLRRGVASNVELNAICFRYGGRIHELRRMGYRIETRTVRRGVYEYELVGEP